MKVRVREFNGFYFPEYKKFFGWHSVLNDYSNILGYRHIGRFTLKEAQDDCDKFLAGELPIKSTVVWEK